MTVTKSNPEIKTVEGVEDCRVETCPGQASWTTEDLGVITHWCNQHLPSKYLKQALMILREKDR
jgi:hypothetical protein